MPEDAYLGQDIIDHAKAFYEQYGTSILMYPTRREKRLLSTLLCPRTLKPLKRTF